MHLINPGESEKVISSRMFLIEHSILIYSLKIIGKKKNGVLQKSCDLSFTASFGKTKGKRGDVNSPGLGNDSLECA